MNALRKSDGIVRVLTYRMMRWLLGASLSAAALGAQAGVLGNMTQMFMSNSTAPSTLSTSDRAGAFGGSFEMRAPTLNVNLVSFDRPRFDAGCGGIEIGRAHV